MVTSNCARGPDRPAGAISFLNEAECFSCDGWRHSVPSPACGGGTGIEHERRPVRAYPLPTPLPQAGEGADRVRGSFSARLGRRRHFTHRDSDKTNPIIWPNETKERGEHGRQNEPGIFG